MTIRTKCWLFSTRDVESLYRSNSKDNKILISRENSVPYSINNSIHTKSSNNLSFINFYSDFVNKDNTYDYYEDYQKDINSKIQEIKIIQQKLDQILQPSDTYNQNISTLFDKIFRLKGSNNEQTNIRKTDCNYIAYVGNIFIASTMQWE